MSQTQPPPPPPPQPPVAGPKPVDLAQGIGKEVDYALLSPVGRLSTNNSCKACTQGQGAHTCCLKCRNFYEADQPTIPLREIMKVFMDWGANDSTFVKTGVTKTVGKE